jgi:hypothetical protein
MRKYFQLLLLVFFISINAVKAAPMFFTVTCSTDVNPLNPQLCELRGAINAANANPGIDYISFNIKGPLPITINLTALLEISNYLTKDAIVIDGSTQPGSIEGDKKIVISGLYATDYYGIRVYSNNATEASEIKNIRFAYKPEVNLMLLLGAGNLTISDCIFHVIKSPLITYNTQTTGLLLNDCNNVKCYNNLFGVDPTNLFDIYSGFCNAIVFRDSYSYNSPGDVTIKIDNPLLKNTYNIIGGTGLNQTNYFHCSQIYNGGCPSIYCNGGAGSNNKISGNLIYNSTSNGIFINHLYDNSPAFHFNINKKAPIITSASFSSGNTILSGTSTVSNSFGDAIEIFLSNDVNVYLGSDAVKYMTTVQTNAFGAWSATLPGIYSAKKFIATSTDNVNNTSDFSAPIITPIQLIPCKDCIGSFAPQVGKIFVLTAWVKDALAPLGTINYTGPKIGVEYPSITVSEPVFSSSGVIIDGWQRIEQEFTIPDNPVVTSDIKIKLLCATGSECYFDDIRIHPKDGSMKSYVYDPETLRLSAELDERNYATFYEYDEEGKLIRVKKETERGVMTIKENRNNTKKK